MSYQIIEQNSIEWLQQQPDYSINYILTSLPNFRQSRLFQPELVNDIEQYQDWIANIVLLLFQKIKPDGLVVLFQDDCQINDQLVNHSIFLNGLEHQANIRLLWQQTIINQEESYYSHLYCYSYSNQFQFNNWPTTVKDNGSNLAIHLLLDFLTISVDTPLDIIVPFIGDGKIIATCYSRGCQVLGTRY